MMCFTLLLVLLVACGQHIDQSESIETNKEHAAAHKTSEPASDSNIKMEEEQQEEMPNDRKQDEDKSDQKTSKTSSLSNLKVHYIDAGQADATLFQFADQDGSYTILYDTGDWNKNDVVNYLQEQDITTIDLIVVSHPHADHIGQMAEIVHTYDVGEVWMSGNEASSQTFQRAIEAVLESDADYNEPKAGEVFDIGPMKIDVLHPESLTGKLNEDSLSLLFTYGDMKFIFTGDAGKHEEAQMIDHAVDIHATILQLGHHGSNTSSSPAFIEAVQPEVAIYSAGMDNSYGHPHPDVVSRIQNAGIDLYGTAVHGTIMVTTDGQTYDITTNKDGTHSPKSTGPANSPAPKKDTESKDTKESPSEEKQVNHHCIDINTASLEEVQEIIHIGPERAHDLINLRPYHSIDDLDKIKGIGPARLDDIKAQNSACVGG
jgi:beta-lactamase superfamily II metal-dependent hydrolase